MKKALRVIASLFIASIPLIVITPPPASAVIAEQPCYQYSWSGEDDTAHEMILPYSLPLGVTTYNTTYVTTNGTLTFGTPDATYWAYPETPSISLAGWDWVTWGDGSLSYGVTQTGFCVEWKVRPFPQSSGELTTIKLTVDTSRLPTWSGIVETTGWLPIDLRRGIRFQSNEEVVLISEAFTINGGRPVEMQSCWDGSVVPMTSTCPAEPPAGQCWDGSTVLWNETCPPIPPDTQCWDGTWISWSQTCPQQPAPVECWDGSEVNYDQQCPPSPYLNSPRNLEVVLLENGEISISWDAPETSNVPVEIYAISWSTTNFTSNGWGISSTSTNYVLSAQLFSSTGGLNQTYQFNVRADNNTFFTYSSYSSSVELFIAETTVVNPTPEPTPTDVTPTPEPTTTPEPQPTETVTPIVTPEPEPSQTQNTEPVVVQTPTPLLTSVPSPEPTPTPEPSINTTPTPLVEQEPTNLEEILDNYTDGESIPVEELLALGIDYSELPPNTLIQLENGVVITAEVADALQIFDNPSELVSAIFTDPSKALTAIANVGADLSPEVRKDAQAVTVSAVVVSQVIAGTSALTLARTK